MSHRIVSGSLALLMIVLASCTAIRQQKNGESSPVATEQAAEFKNLKLLRPANKEELINTMKGFSQALGVRCPFCHVPIEGSDKLNFPSDANPHKDVARIMIQMTRDVNQRHLPRMAKRDDVPVSCLTCHRGAKVPDTSTFVPPPEEPHPVPAPVSR